MRGLSRRIMKHAEALPEATPPCPAVLLHLGKRAAVDQMLSRLARAGHLMRICQGVYIRPSETRFGRCAPNVAVAIKVLSRREAWLPGRSGYIDIADIIKRPSGQAAKRPSGQAAKRPSMPLA